MSVLENVLIQTVFVNAFLLLDKRAQNEMEKKAKTTK